MKQPTINVGGKEYPQQWFSWAEVEKMMKEQGLQLAHYKELALDAMWKRDSDARDYQPDCGWK
jgi:hypothetical protein